MLDFQQKRKVKQFLYSPITIGILLIVTLYAIYATWVVYQKKVKTEEKLAEMQQRVYDLSEKNIRADNAIAYLNTDEGVEEEIRSKFALVKSDERMVVIVDDPASDATNTPPQKTLWQKFISIFGF
jgi:cytoskeletal protein RodZ